MGRREIGLSVTGLVLGLVILLIWLSPRVTGWEPSELAASAWQPLIIEFNQPIDPASAAERFSIKPAVDGELFIIANQLLFQPDKPFEYGQIYTATLRSGLLGANRLPLLRGIEWSFNIGKPRLAYLRIDNGITNIWAQDENGESYPLTDEPFGVWDYNIAPDGHGVLFSRQDQDNTFDLVLAKPDGHQQILLDCHDSQCSSPRWQPGGTLVAFERLQMGAERGASEVWLLETANGELTKVYDPNLLVDAGFTSPASHSPRWSADGKYLAYFKPDARLVIVKDMASGSIEMVPANLEIMGEWSPTDYLLTYTELAFGEKDPHEHVDEIGRVISHTRPSLYQHVVIADFTGRRTFEPSNNLEIDEGPPAWHPEGDILAVGRTATGSGKQIWLIPIMGDEEPSALTNDPFINHTSLTWSPDDLHLAFMRMNLTDDSEEPSIWLLDTKTGKMKLVTEQAFMPQWLP